MNNIELKNSDKLHTYKFNKDEKELFLSLPSDYREFLKRSNGGMVVEPSNCSFKIDAINPSEDELSESTNSVEEFFTWLSYENELPQKELIGPKSILHQHYDTYQEEEFLPGNAIVIARCVHNSLIVLSLNEDDYGSIYYWEKSWQSPKYEAFFKKRILEVSAKYEDIKEILSKPQHPDFGKACDALNYATLIKVSTSFSDFINDLHCSTTSP